MTKTHSPIKTLEASEVSQLLQAGKMGPPTSFGIADASRRKFANAWCRTRGTSSFSINNH
jgi:hypothetical protein